MADHYIDQIGGRALNDRPLSTLSMHYRGYYQTAQGRKTVDMAQNDTLGLFPVASEATLSHVLSLISWSALGAGVTMDIGFEAIDEIGYAGDQDALANNVDVATAGSGKLVAALTRDDLGKQAWELAGLASDPGRPLWIVAIFEGANPASGTVAFEQAFVAR